MTSKIPFDARAFLALIAAAVLFAAPGRAQEAEDGNPATPEAAETPEAAGEEPEEGAPEAAGEEPEEGAADTAEEPGAGEAADGDSDADGGDTAADAETADDGGPIIVEAEEGSVLDDQTFEGEDDDFTPSEEIPVDQPIPFPVDI